MHRHWREFGPPAYAAVAIRFGMVQPMRRADALRDPDDLARFLASLPGVSGATTA